MFKRQDRAFLTSVLFQGFTIMVFKVIISVVIIVGSVCSRIHEHESEQYLVDRPDSEKNAAVNSQCMSTGCSKRALQDDVGPFWANRGKKNPNYRSEPLTAEEPHWVLVRRAEDDVTPFRYNLEPFFVTRGKKGQKMQEDDKNIIQEIFAKMRIQNHHDSELFKNAK